MNLGDELRKRLEESKVEWKRRPEILLLPNIPKPMHGLAPRVVLGQVWWDETRRQAYRSTDYHCIACGVHKLAAKKHRWLEAHEVYEIDYLLGRMTYVETVPLCHYCHNYIHDGRLQVLYRSGKITKDLYRDIMEHGHKVVRDAGLKFPADYDGPMAQWEDWRMVVNEVEYAPKYANYQEWCKGYSTEEEQ